MDEPHPPVEPPGEPSDEPTVEPTVAAAPTAAVTPSMVHSLAGTRPWVLFMAILGFVGAGFMLLASCGMVAFGTVAGDMASEFGIAGAFGMLIYGLFYVFIAGIYVWVSYYLYRYATAIQQLQGEPTTQSLEYALDTQRSFWRLLGIITAVYLVLLFLALIVGIVVAIAIGAAAANS